MAADVLRCRVAATLRFGMCCGLILAGASGCSRRGATERVNVFAAASLGPVMDEIEQEYEAAHPDVDVVVNLAGSSILAAQILAGADAAVFASANAAQMDLVRDDLGLGPATVFATNELVIVVAPGNPLDIAGPDDLSHADLVVALAAPEVPAGAYAAEMLRRAGVTAAASTLELDVRAVVTRVALGEADAGVAYLTDVIGRADVGYVSVADDYQVLVEYPVIAIDPVAGGPVVEMLTSALGRRALSDAGFGVP